MLSSQDHNLKMAESVLAWWQEAGVDHVTDGEPMNWLSPLIARPALAKPVEKLLIAPAAPRIEATPPLAEWPSDIATFKAMIGKGVGLPGLAYGSVCAAPIGEAGATAMVIGDFPEEEEIAAGQFGIGPVARLATNMLLAAEIVPDLSYASALAHSRPATGALPKEELAGLAAFAQHQIALVRPKVIVLFGQAACEALLGEELMAARGQKRFINHNGGKTAAIATFHPRTLIAQPQLKAQAWRDLQMLVRKEYL